MNQPPRFLPPRMQFPLSRLHCLRFAWLLCGLAWSAAHAADGLRSFDVPAGLAETTLKQFAAQAGMEVLFSTEVARGVRTNAVKGTLAVQEAAKQMLSGTPLYVVSDGRHGVLRIARTPNPNAQRAAPKTSGDRPNHSNVPTPAKTPKNT
jgi:iron complex outermembrane receptor protein